MSDNSPYGYKKIYKTHNYYKQVKNNKNKCQSITIDPMSYVTPCSNSIVIPPVTLLRLDRPFYP